MSIRESRSPLGKLPSWAVLLVAVVSAAGAIWQQSQRGPAPPFSAEPVTAGTASPDSAGIAATEADSAVTSVSRGPRSLQATSRNPQPPKDHGQTRSPTLVVHDVSIQDFNGRVAFRGDVDLTLTLDRIARGGRFPHRNDGGTFRNLERRLPIQPTGYYREYVHPTPGIDGPGPQRVVVGRQGEVYYTSDHYKTFRQIR